MKTTTKIVAAVAVLGLVGVFALTSGAFAHGAQTNAGGWQSMNGMMNNQAGVPVNGNQGYTYYGNGQYAAPTINLNGSAAYCYAHSTNCIYNAQTGAWSCPYGCVYHNQAQGTPTQGVQAQPTGGQWSGHGGCC